SPQLVLATSRATITIGWQVAGARKRALVAAQQLEPVVAEHSQPAVAARIRQPAAAQRARVMGAPRQVGVDQAQGAKMAVAGTRAWAVSREPEALRMKAFQTPPW